MYLTINKCTYYYLVRLDGVLVRGTVKEGSPSTSDEEEALKSKTE